MNKTPTCRLVTLGCKVNQYETQYVKEMLEVNGYVEAVEGQRLQSGMGQDAGERPLRGDWAGSDGVHADAAVAPFDGETASEGFDSCFGDGRRDYISRAYRRVGSRDAEHRARVGRLEPAASAGHGAVERAHEDDGDEMLRERYGIGASLHRRKPTASRVVPPETLEEMLRECDVVIPAVGD